MITQFEYRFTSCKRLLERPQAMTQGIPTTADIRVANDLVIERLKKDLDLQDDSTITDLRHAVMKLAD